MSSLSKKERKVKFNTDDLIFRKKSNLSSYVDIEYNSAESLTNKYKLFRIKSKQIINSLAPSKIYIMINEIKNETKRKFNPLDEEINYILEKLDVNLTTLKLRCIFLGKPYNFEKERKLRLSAKEKINKIEVLKEKVELLDHLLEGETKVLNY